MAIIGKLKWIIAAKVDGLRLNWKRRRRLHWKIAKHKSQTQIKTQIAKHKSKLKARGPPKFSNTKLKYENTKQNTNLKTQNTNQNSKLKSKLKARGPTDSHISNAHQIPNLKLYLICTPNSATVQTMHTKFRTSNSSYTARCAHQIMVPFTHNGCRAWLVGSSWVDQTHDLPPIKPMSANNQSDFTYAALQIDEAWSCPLGRHQTIDQAVGAASHQPNCNI